MKSAQWLKFIVVGVGVVVVFGGSVAVGYWVTLRTTPTAVKDKPADFPLLQDNTIQGEVMPPRDVRAGGCGFWSAERGLFTLAGVVEQVELVDNWYVVRLRDCEDRVSVRVLVPADVGLVQSGYATADGLVWENVTPEELAESLEPEKLVAVGASVYASEDAWLTKYKEAFANLETCREYPLCGRYLEYLAEHGDGLQEFVAGLEQGEEPGVVNGLVFYTTSVFGLDNLEELVWLKTEGGL